ncbi:hypothetical protein B0O80DRAFT_434283 [Mortierella sp. GBAus27b]|nr:hypothetical protein B0O80DRAFT_434283 [Mortierella sp. GBAus27b]
MILINSLCAPLSFANCLLSILGVYLHVVVPRRCDVQTCSEEHAQREAMEGEWNGPLRLHVSLLDGSPCVMSLCSCAFRALYLSLSADCLWHHLQCAGVQNTTYVLARSCHHPLALALVHLHRLLFLPLVCVWRVHADSWF